MEMKTEQTQDNRQSKDEKQLVSFMLGEEEFGFDIMDVQEIIRPPNIARVPLTPRYVDGVANLRGMVLPIVDMRTRFGMDRMDDTDRTRVLVIDLNGQRTGLRVDRVKQVDRIAMINIEPPPSVIGDVSSEYVQGVVKLEGGKRIIITLKAEEVCRATETERRQVAAATQAAAVQETDRQQRDRTAQEVTQMVTFRVAREEFGFPIDKVREILRVETARRIPESPAYLLGVLTVRGKLLPIIDLRTLLDQKTLAEELGGKCAELRAGYEAWREELEVYCATPTNRKPGDYGAQQLREWLKQRSSTSQALAESVTQLRAGNEQAVKAVAALLAADAAALAAQFQAVVKPVLEQEIAELRHFESLVVESIREDQRIVVVDAGGILLGLVVDHVNEVMNTPNNCIEPAPQLNERRNAELAGIAKLNEGKRLILVLEASRLLKEQEVQQLLNSSGAQKTGANAADETAQRAQQSREMEERQIVSFRLGDEEFGIPIAQIREIDRYSQITRIPRVPDYVEGVTNLRGEVIPVINLRARFNLPAKDIDDRARIIIVDLDGNKTGLRVDSVSQVLNISNRDVEKPPKAVEEGGSGQFISGIAKVDAGKRMIVFLDVARILTRSPTAAPVAAAAPVETGKSPAKAGGKKAGRDA